LRTKKKVQHLKRNPLSYLNAMVAEGMV